MFSLFCTNISIISMQIHTINHRQTQTHSNEQRIHKAQYVCALKNWAVYYLRKNSTCLRVCWVFSLLQLSFEYTAARCVMCGFLFCRFGVLAVWFYFMQSRVVCTVYAQRIVTQNALALFTSICFRWRIMALLSGRRRPRLRRQSSE